MRRMGLLFAFLMLTSCSSRPAVDDPPPTKQPQAPTQGTQPESEEAEMATEGPWKWAGIEVVGQRTIAREDVVAAVKDMGLEPGHPADWGVEDEKLCETRLSETFELAHVHCGYVRFHDFKAYPVINLVEPPEAARAQLRENPTGEVALPQELLTTHEALHARIMALFNQGEPPMESAEQGYLDYEDDEARELVARLRELAPPRRMELLAAIREDEDMEKRGAAATLLNWAGEVQDSIARVHSLLDDPSPLVRNNISRFMLHYLADASPDVRKEVIPSLCRQLGRPSHGDRNKAAYALLALAEKSPADATQIAAACRGEVERVAEQSILDNVGGVAKTLLQNLPTRVD